MSIDEALHPRFDCSPVEPRPGSNPPDGILAESQAMQEVVSLIDRAARRDTAVLLVGESGTGKELLSRAIHRKSPRANGPFVAVNCSAIPDTLLESELFGHRRGAFTDAREDQPGLFQSANRGTLFLDEIGDMAPALQAKLLRVLQEKEVQPLGASAPVPVDVRVVSATHRDLDGLVSQERFRQDLLYRINVVEVWVPPLRDRLEDLAPLVAHLLDKLGARLGLSGCTVSIGVSGLLQGRARSLQRRRARSSSIAALRTSSCEARRSSQSRGRGASRPTFAKSKDYAHESTT